MGAAQPVETLRAFAALDLDASSLRRVFRVADRLRMASGAPSATWTPQDRLHLTLKFMGHLPADAVVPVGKALEKLAAVHATKPLRLGGCTMAAFPSVEQAAVVVLELHDPDGEVARIARKLDKVAAKHGVAPESRPFRPHLTLARLKRPYDARKWLKPELAAVAGDVAAARLVLYRSQLGAAKDGGSQYVPLATFELAAAS